MTGTTEVVVIGGGYAGVMAVNLTRRSTVARLAPPQPNPNAPSQPPMNPGPSLLARPLTYVGAAIPVVLLVLLIAIASSGH